MKTNHKRFAVVALGVVLSGAVGSALFAQRAPQASSSRPDAKSSAQLVRLGAAPGSTWRYDLALVSESLADGAALAKTTLQASLDVTVLAAVGGDVSIAGRLDQPRLEQAGQVDGVERTMPVTPIERQLAEGFEYVVSARGEVKDVRVSPKLEVFASHLLRSILGYTQLLSAPSGEAVAWNREEIEPLGRFATHYARGSAGALTKTKLKLLESYGQAGFAAVRGQSMALENSKTDVVANALGVVTSLALDETVRIAGATLIAENGVTAHTRLTLQNGRLVPTEERAATTLGPPQTLQAATAPSGRDYWADLNRIAGRDVKGIVTELAQLETSKDEKAARGQRSRLFVAASALLRRDDRAVAEALKLIRAGAAPNTFMIQALGSAGSEAAANALVELLGSTSDVEQSRTVLRALGSASQPRKETVHAMQSLFVSPKIGGLARLMVGSMAYNSRERAPDVANEGAGALSAQLENETDPLFIAETLRALGNSGAPEALWAARKFVAHESSIVRAAAAQAVRRVGDEGADQVLVTLMPDAVAVVRSSALNAALDRQPTKKLFESVANATRFDAEQSVRREGLRVLVDWSARAPAARQVLVWVSLNDSNDKLRALATEGLARHE